MAADSRTDLLHAVTEGYSPPGEERPLRGYATLTAVFAGAFLGALAVAERRGHRLPEGFATADVVLIGLATHKLSRLVTKDRVTSFIRAPFTRYQEPAGYGEVREAPRGHGLRHSVGELLVCPYCAGQWVAGALVLGHAFAPRHTRLLTAMWTAHAIADAAQLAYSAAEKRV